MYEKTIENPWGVPITLFAGADVPVEPEAVEQVLAFASLAETLPLFPGTRLDRVVLTPDFHKGKSGAGGIPIGTVARCQGFVLPQAVGSDVCCGMRLVATDVTTEELARKEREVSPRVLERTLRGLFFEGKRDIPLSPRQREALLRAGLWGLWDTWDDNADVGLWGGLSRAEHERDLLRTHFQGCLEAPSVFSAFEDWRVGSGRRDGRDAQIGSVGGGNHFVELQAIDEVSSPRARQWGLQHGCVAVMAHSGSVGLGHAVGNHFTDVARALFATTKARTPAHGFFPIPEGHEAFARYRSALFNAANFAFANRMFLARMMVRALETTLGRTVGCRLVYDAPHNLIWYGEGGHLHRKGACPAHLGDPVIVPGSMGDHSHVLEGNGHEGALSSACHGAGRVLSRTKVRHEGDALAGIRVVTAVDLDDPAVRSRRDIVEAHLARIREEAPRAYKDVTPVVRTIDGAGIASRVARSSPILTVKG